MYKVLKVGLTVLAASLLLASAVGTSSARSFSMSNQNVRNTWSRLEFQAALTTIRCPVTMESSYHIRTIAKVIGNLIGVMRRLDIKNESCTNGTVSLPAERKMFHFSQEGFTGTLPRITSTALLMTRLRFIFTSMGSSCSYGTESDRVTFASNLDATGTVTSMSPVAGSNIMHKVEGEGLFCSETVTVVGTEGTETVSGSSTRITVTLI